MKLLVAGANRVDAGKTTFSAGLVARTGATGFKPRAGNDFWFDHDDVLDAVADGRLYGKDARRLAAASPGEPDPETINPIHRLWQPTPSGRPGLLGQTDRSFVVDRVAGSYVVNDQLEVPQVVREALPLDDAVRVSDLDAFNEVMATRHVAALGAVERRIADTADAVVESYGDVARPLQGFEPDAVAVVQPHRARIYGGRRYVRACEVATGSPNTGKLEERVPTVLDTVESTATVHLPAVGKKTQSDPEAVADAYAEAYDALLAAV
jgi:predicted P-loop ATPase/GTPase